MIILTEQDRETYEKWSEQMEKRIALRHFSISSINDQLECSEKLYHRTKFRTYSLVMECGSAVHAIAEEVAVKAKLEMAGNPDLTWEEARDYVLSNTDLGATFTVFAMNKYNEGMSGGVQVLFAPKEFGIVRNVATLEAFFSRVGSFLTMDLYKSFMDICPTWQEAEGVLHYPVSETDNIVIYGKIDSVSEKDSVIYIDDIKSTWSAKSKPAEKETTLFQLWMYKNMIEDEWKRKGLSLPKIITRVKWIKSLLPKVVDDFEFETFSFESQIVEINLTDVEDAKFHKRVKTAYVTLKEDCGLIGNTDFGCAYCGYNSVCSFSTTLNEPEDKEPAPVKEKKPAAKKEKKK